MTLIMPCKSHDAVCLFSPLLCKCNIYHSAEYCKIYFVAIVSVQSTSAQRVLYTEWSCE